MCDCSINCKWAINQERILAKISFRDLSVETIFLLNDLNGITVTTCILKRKNKVLGYGLAFKNPIDEMNEAEGQRISYKRASRMYGKELGLEEEFLKEFESLMRRARYASLFIPCNKETA